MLGLVQEYLIREHPATAPTDEQLMQMALTRAYTLGYASAL